jgi:hypothetical protein
LVDSIEVAQETLTLALSLARHLADVPDSVGSLRGCLAGAHKALAITNELLDQTEITDWLEAGNT